MYSEILLQKGKNVTNKSMMFIVQYVQMYCTMFMNIVQYMFIVQSWFKCFQFGSLMSVMHLAVISQ